MYPVLSVCDFKIGCLNLNGAREQMNRVIVFELASHYNIDILFVQESHSDRMNSVDWIKEWSGQII